MKKADMSLAWMLGKGGKEIPVVVHVYGREGELDENAGAAIWLNKYLPDSKLVDFLRNYTAYLVCGEVRYSPDYTEEEFLAEAHKVIANLPYNMGESAKMSKDATTEYLLSLIQGMSVDEIYDMADTIDDNSGDFVARDLNESFIRVRLNDEYQAAGYNGIAYFRIGSTHYNWINEIYMFVHDHGKVKSVIIERDAESDGHEGDGNRDVMINKMPREQFLNENMRFLGSKHNDFLSRQIIGILSKGDGKYSSLGAIKANASRIHMAYNKLRDEEIKNNYTRMTPDWVATWEPVAR